MQDASDPMISSDHIFLINWPKVVDLHSLLRMRSQMDLRRLQK